MMNLLKFGTQKIHMFTQQVKKSPMVSKRHESIKMYTTKAYRPKNHEENGGKLRFILFCVFS